MKVVIIQNLKQYRNTLHHLKYRSVNNSNNWIKYRLYRFGKQKISKLLLKHRNNKCFYKRYHLDNNFPPLFSSKKDFAFKF